MQVVYDEKGGIAPVRFYSIISELSIPFLSTNKGMTVVVNTAQGIYYKDEEDLPTINTVVREQELLIGRKIAVEVEKLRHYILAEDYHQDYLKKKSWRLLPY